MRRAGGRAAEDAVEGMRRVEGLAIVSIAWLLIAWFAGLPYMWNGLGQIDALFEAMSGLTTTGATVFRDFSAVWARRLLLAQLSPTGSAAWA